MRMLLAGPWLMVMRAMDAHTQPLTFCPYCKAPLVRVLDEDGTVVSLMEPVAFGSSDGPTVLDETNVDGRGYPLGFMYGQPHLCRRRRRSKRMNTR